jgi:hypothetical protein
MRTAPSQPGSLGGQIGTPTMYWLAAPFWKSVRLLKLQTPKIDCANRLRAL